MGVQLDGKRNSAGASIISRDGSPVSVRVIRTDEEWVIAGTVCEVLGRHLTK
jgi:acetate kinase